MQDRRSWRWPLLGWLAVTGCAHSPRPAPWREVLHTRIEGRSVVDAPLTGEDRSSPERVSVRLAYSHSRLSARFVGSSVAVQLAGPPTYSAPAQAVRFAIELDGVRLPSLVVAAGGPRTYTLAAGLAGGTRRTHRVRLTKLSEAAVGEVRFYGFVTDGHLLAPPLPLTRRLWIIGDSISCGYGALGLGPHCPFDATTEDASATYAAEAARRLGAELTVVAWSGRGLWQNRDSSQTGTLPQLFAQVLPEGPALPAVYSPREAPHAIVVNLGTNDASAVRPLDDEVFVATAVRFLAELRRWAPAAPIVLTVGPMLTNDQPNHLRALDRVQAAYWAAITLRRAAGDDNVGLLRFPTQDGHLGYGCDYHPSAATHAQMGAQLADVVAKRLHWSQDPQFGRAAPMP